MVWDANGVWCRGSCALCEFRRRRRGTWQASPQGWSRTCVCGDDFERKATETRFRESGRFEPFSADANLTNHSRVNGRMRSLCFPRVCHFWVPTMCRPGAGAPTMHACALTVLRLTQSYNITTVYDLALAGASYTRSARHAYIRKRA